MKIMILLMLLLLITPSYAITLNQTCLDNATLQYYDGLNESCNFGCDNTTNTCNPSTAMQNVYIIIAFIILIVGGIWLARRLH